MTEYPMIFTEVSLRVRPVTTRFELNPQDLLRGNAVVPSVLANKSMIWVQETRDKCSLDKIFKVLSQSQGSSSLKGVSDMGMYVFSFSSDLPRFTEYVVQSEVAQ